MPKLNRKSYFSLSNQYITGSKIGDYLKDPHYFYRKHVIGDIEKPVTDALIIGSAVDYWLMNNEEKFKQKYYLVSRRSKAAPDYEYQLTKTMYDEVELMCRNLLSKTALKELKGFNKQKVLQYDIEGTKQFPGVAGIPDYFKVKDGHATIVDLKTAASAKNPNKYYFHCLDYGYFRQAGLYSFLVSENYNIPLDNIDFFHIVVEKDTDKVYNCYTYKLNHDRIMAELRETLLIFDEMDNNKKFLPLDASFKEAVEIGQIEQFDE